MITETLLIGGILTVLGVILSNKGRERVPDVALLHQSAK